MIHRNARQRISIIILLSVSVSAVVAAGCDNDETVRGAGSIDVPKPASFVLPEKAAAKRGKTASNPSRAH